MCLAGNHVCPLMSRSHVHGEILTKSGNIDKITTCLNFTYKGRIKAENQRKKNNYGKFVWIDIFLLHFGVNKKVFPIYEPFNCRLGQEQ